MKKNSFIRTEKFKKDFKKLSKKYTTLKQDLEIVETYIIDLYHSKTRNKKAIVLIQGVDNTEELEFYKVKKFPCQSIKGKGSNSSFRIIYACFPKTKKIHLIELYYKPDQENENKERIKEFKKNHSE